MVIGLLSPFNRPIPGEQLPVVVFGCFWLFFGVFLESHRSVFFRIPWRAAERPPRICEDFQRFRRESRPASWVVFFKSIFLELNAFF